MSSALASGAPALDAFEDDVVAMFRAEWCLARGDAPLTRIAIVDDEPAAQYLHPEFLLFRRLFERAGLAAGDVVLGVDGHEVADMREARARLSGPMNVDVVVEVDRGGKVLKLRVGREQVRR